MCSILKLSAILAPFSGYALEYKKETYPFKIADGTELTGDIRTPVKFSGKLPVMMIFGGFKNAARVLDLVKADRPVLLASFDYPYDLPRKFEFPKSLEHAPAAKKTIHDTIEGITTFHQILQKREDVDPSKTSVVGGSLGAPFVTIAASRDGGIEGVILVHGFGRVQEVIERQLLMRWEKKHGSWIKPFTWLLAWYAWRYVDLIDPEDAARALRSTQKAFVLNAKDDQSLPKETKEALVNGIQASKASLTIESMEGGHLGPGDDEKIRKILVRVRNWMGKVGLL